MSAELLSFTPAPRLSWHRIRLSEADLQTAVHETIAAAFERAYINAHRPLAMMLWMAFTRDGGACLYLSPGSIPAAATLLNTYRARPCDAPARSPHRPVLDDRREPQSRSRVGRPRSGVDRSASRAQPDVMNERDLEGATDASAHPVFAVRRVHPQRLLTRSTPCP